MSAAGALSPRGPRGPRESSRASSRTVVCPMRRGVRGCLGVGDLMEEMADEVLIVGTGAFTEDSVAGISPFADIFCFDGPDASPNTEASSSVGLVCAWDGTSGSSVLARVVQFFK